MRTHPSILSRVVIAIVALIICGIVQIAFLKKASLPSVAVSVGAQEQKDERMEFMRTQASKCEKLGGLPIWTQEGGYSAWYVSGCAIPCNQEKQVVIGSEP
jgi:hypothetical protein